jgi:hypothetical protein
MYKPEDFFNVCADGFRLYVWFNFISFFKFVNETFIQFFQNLNFDSLSIKFLIVYGNVVDSLKQNIKIINDNNSDNVFLKHIGYFQYNFKRLYAFFTNKRIEPYEENWLCISTITLNNYVHFKLMEHYSCFDCFNDKYFSKLINEELNDYAGSIRNLMNDDNVNILQSMITLKLDGIYKTYQITKSNKERLSLLPLKLSKIRFLTIQYSHPNMTECIYLELEPSAYCCENVILSLIHVKRLLEYQTEYFVFDKDYEISLMDAQIKTVSLNYKQYIQINESDYSVKEWDE